MAEPNIGKMREATYCMRSMTVLVLVVYLANLLTPGARAIATEASAIHTAVTVGAKRNLGETLQALKDHLGVLSGRADSWHHSPSARDRKNSKAVLNTLRAQIHDLDSAAQADFATTARLISDRSLPEVIRQRQADAEEKYRQKMAALLSDIDAIAASKDEAAITSRAKSAYTRLERERLGHIQQGFDPRHLPNSSLKGDPTKVPRTNTRQFAQAGLFDNPLTRLATISPFDISHFPSAADPAYLAATTEVVLTPDIVAQANSLNGNPVQIYNWVRNNVQWLPTWGAIQDSSQTLATRRGNAFDIASLTIALLRASGIPARYVHGTIDVPVGQFANWAGGFQHINAALDFASAGGIPITALTAGGQITTVRMEHIWVEAAVDFVPSRGVVNKSADTWVPMDPSFKQLTVLQGLNLAQIAGVDPSQAASSFLATGTTNASAGWVTGFNPAALQTTQSQLEAALRNYVTTNLPNPTVGAIVGGRAIVQVANPVLAASIPSHIVTVGARYASLPQALEQQITLAFGQNPDGTPNNPQTFPWASLNNQRIIVSFIPASQADQDALNAMIPAGATDGSQAPASIPGYLINVIPQLEVNGTVVMTGSAMTFGSDLTFVFDPQFVTAGTQAFTYDLPAGSYVDIAVIAGSVNQAQITANSASLANTAAIIQSNQAAQTAALTREQLLGDLFQSGILSYFAQYAAGAYLAGLGQGGHHSLAAGLGSLGYEVNVDMAFGIPRSVSSGGIVLNIPIVSAVRQDSEDPSLTRSYTTQIGIMSSALEGAVPEQLFAATGGTAISAVKALSLANSTGQDIYQITPDNQATVLPLIHQSAPALADIQNALASGHTVVTHTDPVSVTGWSGCGYVILDPVTGTGAYKISGGANGSFLKWVDDHAVAFAILGIALGLIEGPIFLLLGILLTAITAIAGLYVFYEESLELGNCEVLYYLYAGLVIGLALLALIPGAGAGFVVALGIFALIGPTAVSTVAKSPACKNSGPPPDDSE